MTLSQIIFILVAAATLGAGLMVVTSKNLVHSALWLIVSLFGVAVFFAMLQANFLAIVQVVVYIGGIAILLIFAIMLSRVVAGDSGPRFNANWGWAGFAALLLFASLAWILTSWPGISQPMAELSARTDTLSQLGKALVAPDAFVLPFELASVLLLAALIGSIFVAWDRK